MPASLDKSLGTATFNAAGTTMALVTSAAAVSGTRIYVALLWAGATTVASFAGGGLTWTIDGQGQVGSSNIAVCSANAPAGLASGTTLTATFSASSTTGLIAAAAFIGVQNAAPIDTQLKINSSGVATASWGPLQAQSANDEGGLAFFASGTDNTGTSTPTGDATEIHDFSNASFFGALTTQYQIVPPNRTAVGNGTWSTVSGSIGNAGIVVLRKDTSGVVTSPSLGRPNYKRVKVH